MDYKALKKMINNTDPEAHFNFKFTLTNELRKCNAFFVESQTALEKAYDQEGEEGLPFLLGMEEDSPLGGDSAAMSDKERAMSMANQVRKRDVVAHCFLCSWFPGTLWNFLHGVC